MPVHPNVKARWLNQWFLGTLTSSPTTWYLALYKDALSTANLPTTANEVARTNGYVRLKCADSGGNTTACWTAATSAAAVTNSTGFQFADPSGAWSSVNAVALHDSTSTGAGGSTIWWFGNLVTTVSVSAGNPVRISSGQLTIDFQ